MVFTPRVSLVVSVVSPQAQLHNVTYPQLVGGLEHVFFFHSDGNVIIPTDELSPSFFRGVGSPHGKPTTRQYLTISHHHEPADINSYEAFRIPMIPITFLSHMLHGAGIFTKKYPKNHPVLQVNILAPWSIWVSQGFLRSIIQIVKFLIDMPLICLFKKRQICPVSDMLGSALSIENMVVYMFFQQKGELNQ